MHDTRRVRSPQAAPIIGCASVIDGDTTEIRCQRIRLFGIDAPSEEEAEFDRALGAIIKPATR